jgi:hypothetical protein
MRAFFVVTLSSCGRRVCTFDVFFEWDTILRQSLATFAESSTVVVEILLDDATNNVGDSHCPVLSIHRQGR